MKYRSMCDLIVSPDDLSMNQYPTRDPAGSNRRIELSAVVRNAGAVASGPFDVDLTIVHEGSVFTLSERCNSGLAPGEEGVFDFIWVTPASFEDGDEVTITVAADEDKICSDSWWGNNSASVTLEILDVYPNEDNWPVNLPGSVKCPPMLMDINGDGKLEIIALSGVQVYAIDQISGQVLWESGYFSFTESDNLGGFTVPVFGDVAGDGLPEIVIDTRQELVILNSTDGTVLHTFDHGLQQGNFSRGPHGVTLADVFPESGKLEIAFVAPENSGDPLSLFLLTVDRGQLIELDRETMPQSPLSYSRDWIAASNLTADQSDELILSYSWYSSGYNSGVWIYDFDETTLQAGFTDSYTRSETENTAGIHAVGEIAGAAGQIAWSRQHTGTNGQAWLLDSDDLSTHQICEQPSNPSDYIHCCILADWDPLVSGLDRIIAPAENQCLAWNQFGHLQLGWNDYYESTDNRFPPLPALANLVAESGFQTSEVIVGTRDGWVNAYDMTHEEVDELGFPYQLPAEVVGGFVAADIDLDGKLEIVFGTMDNYLHVWELGSCPVEYAPWPQSQHDAMRTGALEN